jgi:hypothetical protein
MIEEQEILPKEIHAILEEHTAGGYVYCRIDGKGNIQVYHSFDDEVSFLGITKKLENWIDVIRAEEEMKTLPFLDELFEEDNDDDDGEKAWKE